MFLKIREKFIKIINFIENSPITFGSWFLAMVAIQVVSYLMMLFFYESRISDVEQFLAIFFHSYFMFFLLLYLAVLVFLVFLLGESVKKVSVLLLWGYLLLIIRPIIDVVILREIPHYSFYIFGGVQDLLVRFVFYFGKMDAVGILYGTRVVTAALLFFLFWYILHKKKSLIKAFFGVLGVYAIVFVMCALPSVFVIIGNIGSEQGVLGVNSVDVAKVFISPFNYLGSAEKSVDLAFHYKMLLILNILLFLLLVFFQFFLDKQKAMAILKNCRFPQIVFHLGLFVIGLLLGVYYSGGKISFDFFSLLIFANLILSVVCVWLFSVFINDLEDLKIDKVTNSNRPLVQKIFTKEEYQRYSYIFLFFSLISAAIVSLEFFFLVLFYVFATWMYSCHPFRFRRFIVVSSVVSAVATLAIFYGGFLLTSQQQVLEMFPWKIVGFLFVVYVLVIPLKDLKDIKGDSASGVTTLGTLLGEENARIFLGAVLFLSYLASSFVVGEKELFFFSVVFGAASYWLVTNKKIIPQNLPWWILGVVFVYGILLVSMVF